MKYIKAFEFTLPYIGPIENTPKIGDYVLCKDYITSDIKDRIDSEIGKIAKIEDDIEFYTLKYSNKEYIRNPFVKRDVRFYDFIYWSKTKEEVEAFINQNKYNL